MYWITGRSTTSSISFGCAFVAGRKREPRPAAGMIAFIGNLSLLVCKTGRPRRNAPSYALVRLYHALYWAFSSATASSSTAICASVFFIENMLTST